MEWIPINGPVMADTFYHNNQLAAKNVSIALPAITPVTNDYNSMGTVTLPTPAMIETMEATVTKIGIDLGFRSMVRLESATFEARWVQDVRTADGGSKQAGCKAFLRGVPKGIPSISLEPGSASENQVAIAVTRYQLYVDGVEYWLVDQLNQIMRIGGVDYAAQIVNLL